MKMTDALKLVIETTEPIKPTFFYGFCPNCPNIHIIDQDGFLMNELTEEHLKICNSESERKFTMQQFPVLVSLLNVCIIIPGVLEVTQKGEVCITILKDGISYTISFIPSQPEKLNRNFDKAKMIAIQAFDLMEKATENLNIQFSRENKGVLVSMQARKTAETVETPELSTEVINTAASILMSFPKNLWVRDPNLN